MSILASLAVIIRVLLLRLHLRRVRIRSSFALSRRRGISRGSRSALPFEAFALCLCFRVTFTLPRASFRCLSHLPVVTFTAPALGSVVATDFAWWRQGWRWNRCRCGRGVRRRRRVTILNLIPFVYVLLTGCPYFKTLSAAAAAPRSTAAALHLSAAAAASPPTVEVVTLTARATPDVTRIQVSLSFSARPLAPTRSALPATASP